MIKKQPEEIRVNDVPVIWDCAGPMSKETEQLISRHIAVLRKLRLEVMEVYMGIQESVKVRAADGTEVEICACFCRIDGSWLKIKEI